MQADTMEIVQSIAIASIPDQRKLAILRKVRDLAATGSPYLVPRGTTWIRGDSFAVVGPLMAEETDLSALAVYSETAAKDEQKRYGEQVRRAVRILAEVHRSVKERDELRFVEAAGLILAAAAVYQTGGVEQEILELLASRIDAVRVVAAGAAAKLGIEQADTLAILFEQLGSDDIARRRWASEKLAGVRPVDEAERGRWEDTLLAHMGEPSEDYALRLLTACGGRKSVETLLPLLDGPDVPRAVYAAWGLAQLPDRAAARKAVRRLAVYGVFRHQEGQQERATVDIAIARSLGFHTVIASLDPGATQSRPDDPAAPVQIPAELRKRFTLDEAEQAFAIRVYRYVTWPQPVRWNTHVMDVLGNRVDASYVPLLKVIAAEDPKVGVLHVKDLKVAHFQYRKAAAQAIARVTGEAAAYVGLAGEELDSEQFPARPYEDQDALVAKFVVRRLEQARLVDDPQSGADGQRVEAYRSMLRELEESFGTELLKAIRAEADRRGLTDSFLKAGLSAETFQPQ